MPDLILASRSPQRRAILEQLGVGFTVEAPDADELEEGPPGEIAVENAYRKAAAVSARRPDQLVLGADTVVHLGGRIYGKAPDLSAARFTLRALSGRRHAVTCGLCLIRAGSSRTATTTTLVDFRTLDERLIDWYLAREEWRERAGAYAIQGAGAALVAGIEGDYWNVVGLPVVTLLALEPGLLDSGSGKKGCKGAQATRR